MLENRTPAKEDNEEVERDSKIMEKAYTETTNEVLGRPRKKKKPCISVESSSIIDQREETYKRIYIKHKVKENQTPTKTIVCRKR